MAIKERLRRKRKCPNSKKDFPEHSGEACQSLIHKFWKSGGPRHNVEIDFSKAPIARFISKKPKPQSTVVAVRSKNLVDGGQRERNKAKAKKG